VDRNNNNYYYNYHYVIHRNAGFAVTSLANHHDMVIIEHLASTLEPKFVKQASCSAPTTLQLPSAIMMLHITISHYIIITLL
jgi:hypothetical protein